MEALIIILTILIVCSLLASHKKSETSAADRTDGDSHVSYRRDGELLHESDCCYGCMANRVEELQNDGCHMEEIVYGRRHSGDLEW